jgi:hypothetical protein
LLEINTKDPKRKKNLFQEKIEEETENLQEQEIISLQSKKGAM